MKKDKISKEHKELNIVRINITNPKTFKNQQKKAKELLLSAFNKKDKLK
jgi:hypothetical protein